MKRFLSLLLAFAMVFSLAVPAMAADSTTTIYFENTDGWAKVNAYYWSPSNTVMTTWPGIAMTKVEGEENIYAIEVPTEAVNIIFNDDSTQTGDLTIPTDGKNMYSYTSRSWSTYGAAGTGNITGGTSGNVTASYTPSSTDTTTAKITGVSITVDGEEYTSGNVTITPNSTVVYTVSGTNFAHLSTDNNLNFAPGHSENLNQGWWTIDREANTATWDLSAYIGWFGACNGFEVRYSNDNGQNWTGTGIYLTYDPDGMYITGVSITGDTVTYDPDTNTYITVFPQDAESVTYTTVISGAGLKMYLQDPGTMRVRETVYLNGEVDYVDEFILCAYSFFTYNEGTGNIELPAMPTAEYIGSESVYEYSNDGGNTWVTACTQVYRAATTETAKITGVSITVDGTEYTSGQTAVIKPDTQSIILNVTGTNLQNATSANFVNYSYTAGDNLTSGWWVFGGAGTSATSNLSRRISSFISTTTAHEIEYSNDGQKNWTGTGVYVIYDDGETTFYDVTVMASENGTVKAPPKSVAGGEITLTVTPEAGYQLGTLTVLNGNVEVSYYPTPSDNVYFFNMPEGNVTVSATFVPDTTPTYAVTISDAITNGTVSATPNPAKEGDTVTVTVTPDTGYAYVVNSLKVTDATGGEVEVDEDTKTFVMPDSSVTVYAEFEKLSTTSADIVWGSMSFTYSDDTAAWSCDAEGGDQVTVTNNGDTGFTASVAYAANEDYEDLGVTGSFDTDSATLEKDASQTFTLTLSGKPNRALNGNTIGSVTVTITANTAAE